MGDGARLVFVTYADDLDAERIDYRFFTQELVPPFAIEEIHSTTIAMEEANEVSEATLPPEVSLGSGPDGRGWILIGDALFEISEAGDVHAHDFPVTPPEGALIRFGADAQPIFFENAASEHGALLGEPSVHRLAPDGTFEDSTIPGGYLLDAEVMPDGSYWAVQQGTTRHHEYEEVILSRQQSDGSWATDRATEHCGLTDRVFFSREGTSLTGLSDGTAVVHLDGIQAGGFHMVYSPASDTLTCSPGEVDWSALEVAEGTQPLLSAQLSEEGTFVATDQLTDTAVLTAEDAAPGGNTSAVEIVQVQDGWLLYRATDLFTGAADERICDIHVVRVHSDGEIERDDGRPCSEVVTSP